MIDILLTILCILAALVALGFALAPVMFVSGWYAHRSAKKHAKAAQDIDRLLSQS